MYWLSQKSCTCKVIMTFFSIEFMNKEANSPCWRHTDCYKMNRHFLLMYTNRTDNISNHTTCDYFTSCYNTELLNQTHQDCVGVVWPDIDRTVAWQYEQTVSHYLLIRFDWLNIDNIGNNSWLIPTRTLCCTSFSLFLPLHFLLYGRNKINKITEKQILI